MVITKDIPNITLFCIPLKCCKRWNRAVGKVENKQNDKNWLNRRTSVKMFTKFLIKIGSNFFYRSHDTILIRLSDGNTMPNDFEMIFWFYFCVHTIIFCKSFNYSGLPSPSPLYPICTCLSQSLFCLDISPPYLLICLFFLHLSQIPFIQL